jgi:hypothetical protein
MSDTSRNVSCAYPVAYYAFSTSFLTALHSSKTSIHAHVYCVECEIPTYFLRKVLLPEALILPVRGARPEILY